MSTNRNYEIALARLSGEELSDIAKRHGVSRSHASILAKSNAWMVDRCEGREIPLGLTARAAIAIHDAIGLWPSESDKLEVEQRAMEILRSHAGRRVIMKEIGAWLGITGTPFRHDG